MYKLRSVTITRRINKIISYSIIILAVTFSIAPLIWLVGLSISPQGSFGNVNIRSFFNPDMSNYNEVLNNTPFKTFLANSFLVALGSVVLSLIIACLSAYGIVRLKFYGKGLFLGSILLLEMIPAVVLIIPYFVLFYNMGLVGNHLGLILSHTTLVLPFAIWMLRGFFSEISPELMDSAEIDGCSPFRTLISIVLPLSLPSILSVALLAFALSWNNFLFAFILSDRTSRTAPVAIQSYITDKAILWGQVAAAGSIILIPILLVAIFAQRVLIVGLTRGISQE
jgi:multiple sugar transport system permease protein